MNQESFKYIKEIANEYIKELNSFITSAGGTTGNPITIYMYKLYLYNLLTRDEKYVKPSGKSEFYANESSIPSARKILIPDTSDSEWVSARMAAVRKSITLHSPSKTNPTDSDIVEYLRKFDSSIPTNAQIPLTDPVFKNAWDKWYKPDKSDVYEEYGAFTPNNIPSALVIANAIKNRLSNFNFNATDSTKVQQPTVDPNQGGATEESIDISSERLDALERFLMHSRL
jgi:hypothetical protein